MARRETADDIKNRLDRGEPIQFVDSRSPAAWEASDVKLPGAVRIPADQVDDNHRVLPERGQPIVTYCT
jgi:rhodanese-related sulfurtransferase